MSAIKAAFFIKNIPAWERALRFLLGAATIALGARLGNTAGLLALASGVVFILTGVFGFCPMCALAGRRLRNRA